MMDPMIRIYTGFTQGQNWIARYRGTQARLICVLGFTQTGLIPGISAAGATPEDRKYTAIADAEFLVQGLQPNPRYPLPPLIAGASPVFISRAVVEQLQIPVTIVNAGLPVPPSVPCLDWGGKPADCVSTGSALPLAVVEHLFEQGMQYGEAIASSVGDGYLILGESVVGGTTTALGVLTGLGYQVSGKINSSHPTCNHDQKWQIVQEGLQQAQQRGIDWQNPLAVVAALGDPMQAAVAGLAIAASRTCGVLLAGGTQMLAVYAFMQRYCQVYASVWRPEQVIVGTTRWVAEDPTGDTVGLAQILGEVPLIATQLSFADSRFPQLQVYEQGFVKEGVAAGGCAIASHLSHDWQPTQLLWAIEALLSRFQGNVPPN